MTGKRQIITTLAVIAAIGVIVWGVLAVSHKPAATTTTTPASSGASPSQSTSSTYRDGTYQASGRYRSPGGTESITVSLTLSGGVVTDSSLRSGASDPTAEQYQAQFAGSYKPLVVGKNLDDIQLDRVSGSSLTSGGFDAALEQIKTQARA